MDDLSHFVPKFRWGNVTPTQAGNRVRVGPGYQFYKLVPNYVMEVSAGRGLEEHLEAGNTQQAITNYWEAVDQLVKEKVDVVIIGGFPVSANFGRAQILSLIKDTKERYGLPATSPAEAFLASMQHLGLKTVAVGSRWIDELNKKLAQYLGDGGVDVKAISSRAQTVDIAHRMTFEDGLEIALGVGREAGRAAPDADAILVPGGAAMSLHVIPLLEQEFGKPVLTNLSSEVWQVLVHTGVIPPVKGWGRLLEQP